MGVYYVGLTINIADFMLFSILYTKLHLNNERYTLSIQGFTNFSTKIFGKSI